MFLGHVLSLKFVGILILKRFNELTLPNRLVWFIDFNISLITCRWVASRVTCLSFFARLINHVTFIQIDSWITFISESRTALAPVFILAISYFQSPILIWPSLLAEPHSQILLQILCSRRAEWRITLSFSLHFFKMLLDSAFADVELHLPSVALFALSHVLLALFLLVARQRLGVCSFLWAPVLRTPALWFLRLLFIKRWFPIERFSTLSITITLGLYVWKRPLPNWLCQRLLLILILLFREIRSFLNRGLRECSLAAQDVVWIVLIRLHQSTLVERIELVALSLDRDPCVTVIWAMHAWMTQALFMTIARLEIESQVIIIMRL